MSKLFGTDGIRGEANIYPMTPDIAFRVGRAVAYVFRNKREKHKILVGKDTRLSCYMFEHAIAAGITSMGVNTYLVGPMPTPAIAFLVRNMRADAGIIISASHNPFNDNGIKFFSKEGKKLPMKIEHEIEKLTLSDEINHIRPTGKNIGKVFRVRDTLGRYVVYAKSTFPENLSLNGLRVVIDCANGATYKVAPIIFEELGAEVFPINIDPNGTNINEKCGSLHPSCIQEATKVYRADIGISFDGDGDRVLFCDENQEIVDGDETMAILAKHMKQKNKLSKNTVVATIMSNLGLERFLKKEQITLIRTDVGDRNIAQLMFANGYNLGGEQSGHIVLSDFNPTGDGVVTALQVLSIMKEEGKKLSEMKREFIRIPQRTKSVYVSKKIPLDEIKEIKDVIDEAEKTLSNKGRIIVRYSGTEPVVRIAGESEDKNALNTCIDNISDVLRRCLL
ncbi:MAG: phosphoglucosamine mutase [Deltaproteobacteria bacterium]|nr:phosphoglucosamine mutase [Deltaproteobacteria bacterium]